MAIFLICSLHYTALKSMVLITVTGFNKSNKKKNNTETVMFLFFHLGALRDPSSTGRRGGGLHCGLV